MGRRRFTPIAIDIGASAVKLLQLATDEARTTVLAARRVPLHEDQEGKAGAGPAAIRTALNTGGFVGRRAVLVLPDAAVRCKSLRLPQMPPDDLAAATTFAAAERFADVGAEDEVRFMVVGPVQSGRDTQQEVVAMVADAAALRRWLRLTTDLRLRVERTEAQAPALFRPFERFLQREEDRELVNAFIEIGYSGSRVLITRGAAIAFYKAIDVGGRTWDRLVAESLGEGKLAPAQTAQLRRRSSSATKAEAGRPGPPPAGDIPECLLPSIEQLGRELSLCLRYYAVTFRGQRPESVTCIGGESNQPALLARLSEAVHLPVRLGYPLRGIDVPDGLDDLNTESGAAWAAPLGAVLADG